MDKIMSNFFKYDHITVKEAAINNVIFGAERSFFLTKRFQMFVGPDESLMVTAEDTLPDPNTDAVMFIDDEGKRYRGYMLRGNKAICFYNIADTKSTGMQTEEPRSDMIKYVAFYNKVVKYWDTLAPVEEFKVGARISLSNSFISRTASIVCDAVAKFQKADALVSNREVKYGRLTDLKSDSGSIRLVNGDGYCVIEIDEDLLVKATEMVASIADEFSRISMGIYSLLDVSGFTMKIKEKLKAMEKRNEELK